MTDVKALVKEKLPITEATKGQKRSLVKSKFTTKQSPRASAQAA